MVRGRFLENNELLMLAGDSFDSIVQMQTQENDAIDKCKPRFMLSVMTASAARCGQAMPFSRLID